MINRAGGAAKAAGADLADQVRAAFAAAGAKVDVALVDGADLAPAIRDLAKRESRLVVAGGDGTISCAAEGLAGTPVELAILPLGTLNHLARDAGIPANLGEAAALAVHGAARAIDTVRIGPATFINNASIGLYPAMVRSRESLQGRGWSKPLAAVPAAWDALTRAHDLRLEIDFGQGPQWLVTPLLFVGNNHYSLNSGEVGQRALLAAGELCVLAVRHRSRLALAWFALRAMVGKADHQTDFVTVAACTSLRVRADQANFDVALDGEVKRMAPPLEFTMRPQSLQLVAPPPPAALG